MNARLTRSLAKVSSVNSEGNSESRAAVNQENAGTSYKAKLPSSLALFEGSVPPTPASE